jgi:hypothetical protein
MSTVLSVLALVVSVVTAAYAGSVLRSVSNREITNTAITDYYASMRELTKLQLDEWRLAHLFEVETNYANIAATLRSVAPAPASADSVMLSLRERAAALTLFGLYEHVVYQLEEVATDGDTVRARFLRDAVAYFTQRLLPNPRLRYLWAKEGGNLECEFEENVRAHYKANLKQPLDGWDEKGPYGAV